MRTPNLLIALALFFFVGITIGCDSDNNSSAQDMEEPGPMDLAPMAVCPCNFDHDFWTAMGWMTLQGGGLFNDCGTETNVIELSGGINNQLGNVSINCVNQIGTAIEMDGSLFCEASVACIATSETGMESVTQDIYFEKIIITQEEQVACQNLVEDIAMTLGISCN
ncbi:MAG: hypothetical protein DHS20C13_01430 [Thermodesulfobacteriota bacterium]|nr:MAG: hypothetical protein DHS20C13_01430 [Thermodesulfobacteriota bacterium]